MGVGWEELLPIHGESLEGVGKFDATGGGPLLRMRTQSNPPTVESVRPAALRERIRRRSLFFLKANRPVHGGRPIRFGALFGYFKSTIFVVEENPSATRLQK